MRKPRLAVLLALLPMMLLGREKPFDLPSVATLTNETRYLEWKWRLDVSDPTTGLDSRALGRALAELMPAWKRDLPWPEAKARMFAFCCDRVAIDVSGLDWFPAFALWSRDTMHGERKVRDLHPVLDELGKRDREVTKRRMAGRPLGERGSWFAYHDFDHSAPYWEDALRLGFPGFAKRLKDHWRDTEYYRVRQVAIDAALRLLDRLIAQGERKAEAKVKGEGERTRLSKQVASLRRLRSGAPVTALDALEFIYLYWVLSEEFEGVQVRTLGNLDRLLTPYYRADLAAGRTTEAEFREQVRHFWWQWGSMDYYWGQPVFFGGTEADGLTAYNEVSRILLEVHDELALPTPKLHLKMGRSTPDWVWRKSLEMMRRQRPISFIGEEPHWRVMRSMGCTADEAREFILWGCYEWAVRDSANDTCGATVSLLKPVETLLADAARGTLTAATFEDFKRTYGQRLTKTVEAARDCAFENEKALEEVNPSLLFSLATAYSVERGVDAFAGGMRHGNNSSIWMIGLGTAADALLAVKEIVYEKKELSLAGLGRLMADDWKDREDLRLRMLRSKRKWGNNDPEANELASWISKTVAKPLNGRANSRGGVFKAMGHSARRHIDLGRETGATPDGRKAGEEMSKNISPTMGADTEGPTALLGSVAHLDACDLPGDFPLDVALLPGSVSGEKGLVAMRTLIETYFANGGLVIQFNIHDAETLRDAQRHPERYANLQVRVCGWNVRWNDIPKVEQDKFIRRAEGIAQ